MKKEFKIQVPTSIIRSSSINAKQFILLAKLIQGYYLSGGKLSYSLNHKAMMNHIKISDNKTFKEAYNTLCDNGFVYNKIEELPRKDYMQVILSSGVVPQNNENVQFTQLTKNVLDKVVINSIGHVGVRLLYYYKSFINSKDYTKQFAHPSEEMAAKSLGLSKKTVISYNKKLVKCKFIKIDQYELSHNNEYITVDDKELIHFTKYNNHYFIMQDKIDEYVQKNTEKMVI